MIDASTVYIVDDDDGMRESISFVLRKADIVSEAFSTGQKLIDSLDGQTPGCLVVDFQMPEMTGLKMMSEIRERCGQVPFVLITGHGSVPIAVEAMKMGAITVIEKPFHHQVFLDSVRDMIDISKRRRESLLKQSEMVQKLKLLTARENEIAKLVVDGVLTKQIAKRLGISVKTVEVHRSHITKKLGVESIAQLVKLIVDARGNEQDSH